MDTVTAWKKPRFILSDSSGFYIIDNLSLTFYAFAWRILISLSVDEILLLRYVNLSSKSLPLRVNMALSYLKHLLSGFI